MLFNQGHYQNSWQNSCSHYRNAIILYGELPLRLNQDRKSFYKGDFPAATWVQISRLYMSTALVEVEVIAHLPNKKE